MAPQYQSILSGTMPVSGSAYNNIGLNRTTHGASWAGPYFDPEAWKKNLALMAMKNRPGPGAGAPQSNRATFNMTQNRIPARQERPYTWTDQQGNFLPNPNAPTGAMGTQFAGSSPGGAPGGGMGGGMKPPAPTNSQVQAAMAPDIINRSDIGGHKTLTDLQASAAQTEREIAAADAARAQAAAAEAEAAAAVDQATADSMGW